MLNNLRLIKGFSKTTFTQTTGLAWDCVESAIHSYINEGLMELDHCHYRATSHGYQYLDELTQRFLPTT
jgi:coproporphyrinogen III oxidase-like Fe-S oxidoreductase